MIPADRALQDPKRATRFAFWRLCSGLPKERHGPRTPLQGTGSRQQYNTEEGFGFQTHTSLVLVVERPVYARYIEVDGPHDPEFYTSSSRRSLLHEWYLGRSIGWSPNEWFCIRDHIQRPDVFAPTSLLLPIDADAASTYLVG